MIKFSNAGSAVIETSLGIGLLSAGLTTLAFIMSVILCRGWMGLVAEEATICLAQGKATSICRREAENRIKLIPRAWVRWKIHFNTDGGGYWQTNLNWSLGPWKFSQSNRITHSNLKQFAREDLL